jgi:hypothetical protein
MKNILEQSICTTNNQKAHVLKININKNIRATDRIYQIRFNGLRFFSKVILKNIYVLFFFFLWVILGYS